MRSKFFTCLVTLITIVIFGCGGDSGTSNNPDNGGGGNVVTVSIRDNFFDPRSITIQPGTTVRWVMRGSMPDHTVTENNGSFNSGFRFRNNGDQFERTFTSADSGTTFLYHCQTHWVSDEMQGSIRVGNSAPEPPPRY